MEGPILVLKAWWLTGLVIWGYKRWFQRLAPASPRFEAFCATRPVLAAISGAPGFEARAAAALVDRLGARAAGVATLGGFPWPHYRLALSIESRHGAVLVRVTRGDVLRARDRELPALASVVRDVLNGLPDGVEAWLHAGLFDNGLVDVPPGGWRLERGSEQRVRLRPIQETPGAVTRASQIGTNSPAAAPSLQELQARCR